MWVCHGPVDELPHSIGRGKFVVAKTPEAESSGSENFCVNQGIALWWKRFRFVQARLAVACPGVFAGNPLTTQEAELCKATTGLASAVASKLPFVTGVDVSPSFGGVFTVSTLKLAAAFHEKLSQAGTHLLWPRVFEQRQL